MEAPARKTPRFWVAMQPSIIRVYKVAGLVALTAILVGLIDTIGRAFLPDLLRLVLSSRGASTVAPAMSSMMIYLLMAIVLVLRPEGLFPVSSK